MSYNRFMNKIKDILVLFFAGCDRHPDAFAPAHAGLAADSLCDSPVDHDGANLTLGSIVRWLHIGLCQKSEVIGCRITVKSVSQFFGQLMISAVFAFASKSRPENLPKK
jgi:hypothetical protein